MSAQLTALEQERFELLLIKAVDGELDAKEEAEFNKFISSNEPCRQEWRRHKELKEVTETMRFKAPPAEVWDGYWLEVYNRLERGIGWILLSLGSAMLLTYSGFKAVEQLISDPNVEGVVKAGILLVIGGGAVLFVSVLREKLFTRKSDAYKEVKR